MAKRSTPLRGVSSFPPQRNQTLKDQPLEGRPTVQELQSLAALEAVAQMERAQKEPPPLTEKELVAQSEPIQRVRPPRPPPSARSDGRGDESVPQPLASAYSGRVMLPQDPAYSGRVVLPQDPAGNSVRMPLNPARQGQVPSSQHTQRPLPSEPVAMPRAAAPGHYGPGREIVLVEPPAQAMQLSSVAQAPLAPLSGRSDASPVRAYPLSFAEASDPRLLMLREPDSPRAAAFRVLRYRMEQIDDRGAAHFASNDRGAAHFASHDRGAAHFASNDRGAAHFASHGTTVLAVCTPRPGQGGTTAAANLALALSECNRARVCLMEGNLRRPALASLFGFKPPACLAERLQSDRDRPLEPWRVAELSPSLHVLAARESTPRHPLVDGPAFGAGIEALRRAGYRHIVVDGPEVLGIADMNLIEEVVDGVVLVARGGVTAGTDLAIAAGQLNSKKLRGILLLDGE